MLKTDFMSYAVEGGPAQQACSENKNHSLALRRLVRPGQKVKVPSFF